MIAKIKIGKNFIGALEYNTNKLNHPDIDERAELLESNFSSLETDSVKKELLFLEQLNPNLERTTFHTSLNFGKNEEISNELMLSISKEYMHRMGFGDNMYAIVRHKDTDHPHCHILCHRTKLDGKTVSDSNSYHKSNEILRSLEDKYGLTKVNSIYDSKNKNITKNEIEYTLRTKKPTLKAVLEQLVSVAKAKAFDINDFVNRLQQKGIKIFFRQDGDSHPVGLLFLYQGKVIPASKLKRDFGLPGVLEYFKLTDHHKLPEFANYVNEHTNKALVSQGFERLKVNAKKEASYIFIKAVINQALAQNKSIGSFIRSLEQNDINCQFNVAKTGRVTGMSLIYNGKAYKSSDIDRNFSSNKIFKKLGYEQIRDSETISKSNAATRARYGDQIPKANVGEIRDTEKQSSRNLQSNQNGELKIRTVNLPNIKSTTGAANSNNIPYKQAETIGEGAADYISGISTLFNPGYSKDGLNTKRNDRKSKNKPTL